MLIIYVYTQWQAMTFTIRNYIKTKKCYFSLQISQSTASKFAELMRRIKSTSLNVLSSDAVGLLQKRWNFKRWPYGAKIIHVIGFTVISKHQLEIKRQSMLLWIIHGTGRTVISRARFADKYERWLYLVPKRVIFFRVYEGCIFGKNRFWPTVSP